MGLRDRLMLTVIFLSVIFLLSTAEGDAHAQQSCGLPSPQSEQLTSLIDWTELALQFERESWDTTRDWYAENGTHVGQYMDEIMMRLQQLVDGTDDSEWELIGVSN